MITIEEHVTPIPTTSIGRLPPGTLFTFKNRAENESYGIGMVLIADDPGIMNCTTRVPWLQIKTGLVRAAGPLCEVNPYTHPVSIHYTPDSHGAV